MTAPIILTLLCLAVALGVIAALLRPRTPDGGWRHWVATSFQAFRLKDERDVAVLDARIEDLLRDPGVEVPGYTTPEELRHRLAALRR